MSRTWRSVATVTGWQMAASLCYYSIFAATGVVRGAFSLSASSVGFFLTAALFGYTLALFRAERPWTATAKNA